MTISVCAEVTAEEFDGDIWNVPLNAARCVIENAEAYLQQGRRVIIIRPSICPDIDVNNIAFSEKRKSIVPSTLPKSEKEQQDAIDLIVYTDDQLKCLIALDDQIRLDRLPKKPLCP